MDQHLLDAFHRCRTEPDADEGRVAALVAGVLDPALDYRTIEADLDRLARGCAAGTDPWAFLAALGFAGNSDDYGALDNSNLARVLATRRGIPITLGVVLIRVARAAGRKAVGINFPGHFLVQVDDLVVDPFVLQPLDAERFLERLPEDARALPRGHLFAPASTVAVGLRMLNNVKLAFSRMAQWDRALDVIDAQLRLVPDEPALHLERGDVWRRLGLVKPARESFQRALEVAAANPTDDSTALQRAVQARLNELGSGDDTIH